MEMVYTEIGRQIGRNGKDKKPTTKKFCKRVSICASNCGFPYSSKVQGSSSNTQIWWKTDPVLHIEKYQAAADIYAVPDEMRCRAFSGTITGSAQIWYNGLPRGQISSFNQLAELFINNFCFGAKPVKRVAHLLSVRQKEGESTRDYITRFNNEKLEVVDYEEKTAITALMSGLLPKIVLHSCQRPSKDNGKIDG